MQKNIRSLFVLTIITMLLVVAGGINAFGASEQDVKGFGEDFASWSWSVNTRYNVTELERENTNISAAANNGNLYAELSSNRILSFYTANEGGTGYINFDIGKADVGKVTVNLRVRPVMVSSAGNLYIKSTENETAVPLLRLQNINGYPLLGLLSEDLSVAQGAIALKYSWGTSDAGAKAKDAEGYVPLELVFERADVDSDWDIKVFNKAYSTETPIVTGLAPKEDYPVIDGMSVYIEGSSVLYVSNYEGNCKKPNFNFTENFPDWSWEADDEKAVSEIAQKTSNISVDTRNGTLYAKIDSEDDLVIGGHDTGDWGYVNFNVGKARSGKYVVNLRVKPTIVGHSGFLAIKSSSTSKENRLFFIKYYDPNNSGRLLLDEDTVGKESGVQYNWGDSAKTAARTGDNDGYLPLEFIFERPDVECDWDVKVYNKAYSTTEPFAVWTAPKEDYPVVDGISLYIYTDTSGPCYIPIDSYSVKLEGYYSDWGDAGAENISAEIVFADSLGNVHTDIIADAGELMPQIMLTNNSSLRLRGSVYLAEYDGRALESIETEGFKLLDGEKTIVELSGIAEALFNERKDMRLLVWSNTLTPFMKPMKVIYNGEAKRVEKGDSYWLEVNPVQTLSAKDLKVENFVITDCDGLSVNIDEVRYYFSNNRLMLKLANVEKIKESYLIVSTNVSAVEGGIIDLSETAKPNGVYDTSLYETNIQSISLLKNGKHVFDVKEDGTYEIKIKIINQDRKTNKKLTIFKQTENSIVPIENISIADCNDEMPEITGTIYLKKGENICAIAE